MNRVLLVLAALAATASASYGGLSRGYRIGSGRSLVGTQGSWGAWGYWSRCSKNCGGGKQTRSRECIKPTYVIYGNGNCPGSAIEQRSCNKQYCNVDGGWTEWGYYGECDATCGGGRKYRYRTCTNPAPAYGGADCYGSASQYVDCNSHSCSVDGVWTEWGYYGECDATCGGGRKTRYRTCTNPAPAYGGADCYGAASEYLTCNTYSCAVNGGWTEWGHYGECDATCGGGHKYRYRTCTNPAPAHGGADCYGSASEYVACNDHYCSVNGGWTEWGHYGECDATCGGGHKYRYRTCTNPAPAYGGADCYGSASEYVACNDHYCSVNGGWTEWGHYGECDATCGGGHKYRYRTCTNPAPAYGGADCYGSASQYVDCNDHYCSVNGGWTEWGNYGECDATCGGGHKYRYRTCTNPAPAYGGAECYGSASEYVDCNSYSCAVNGGWSEWGYYGDCDASCGGGHKYRYRTCTNPAPAHGGADCYGSASHSVACNDHYCSVNGGWTEWGSYGDCSAACGAGTKIKRRTCSNPSPAYGGSSCYGDAVYSEPCTGYHCQVHGGWSEWGAYSDCSASCGAGTKTSHRYCNNPAPAYGGHSCVGKDTKTLNCVGYSCPRVDGGWTYWTSWSPCAGTCGTGRSYRSRSCTNPAPAYHGASCQGRATENKSCLLPNRCGGYGGGHSGGY